ncbi:MAG TPA: hypothetical protein DEH78_31580 [Solibacterales bacterium]|nr:hypothetical protein [Bryobacterales bacterium]
MLAAGALSADPAGIASMNWLAGCWEGGNERRQIAEVWMRPGGGTMLGVGRTVAGGKTVSSEFLRIDEKDGVLVYTALVGAQKPVPFKAVKTGPGEIVFENPEHDFPQRIVYKLGEGGKLGARIEGNVNGKLRQVDYSMQRAKCE